MTGVRAVVQGKKGTGADKEQIGIRCPGSLYKRLEAGMEAGETMSGRALKALHEATDLEEEAGDRLPELKAAAILERTTLGRMVARLALESLDAKRKGKR